MQRFASERVFAHALSGYIHWLSSQIDSLKTSLEDRKLELINQARQLEFAHDRIPDIVASLMIGWESFQSGYQRSNIRVRPARVI